MGMKESLVQIEKEATGLASEAAGCCTALEKAIRDMAQIVALLAKATQELAQVSAANATAMPLPLRKSSRRPPATPPRKLVGPRKL